MLQVLDERRSVPSKQLSEPGPDHDTLLRMLRSAARVPDHGKLVPFRFLRIAGADRLALGELMEAQTRKKDPQASAAVLQKERERLASAPLVLVVVARLQPEHKVPVLEQWQTAGCVCFSLLLAAQAYGFGAQWLTGWAAYDEAIQAALGLGEHERVAGFIHIGTAVLEAPERDRPDVAALLQDWHAHG